MNGMIKLGDPQPSPCPICKGVHGFSWEERMVAWYIRHYNPDGTFDNGGYGDANNSLYLGMKAYCRNCSATLDFRILHG